MSNRRTLLALAFVLAGLATACYDKSDYSPTATQVDRIIVLSAENGATSLPADGFSRLRIEARLVGDPDFAKRTVIFSTSNGTLAGGSPATACTGCVMVPADGSGRAVVDLVSSQQVGTAVVRAWPADAPGITASLPLSFGSAPPDATLQFVAAPDRAPADGATVSTFTVGISPALPAGSRQVSFQTTAGTFAPGGMSTVQVNADGGGRASASLVSPRQITTARVAATVNGVTREASIRFERALPDLITAAVDMPVATASTSTRIHVTASLLRDVGTVTDGTVVTFRATRANGSAVGIFTNVTTSANGMAEADFLPNTTEGGTVTITAGAQDNGVKGTVQVVLTGG